MKIFILTFFTFLFIISCKSDTPTGTQPTDSIEDSTSMEIKKEVPPVKAQDIRSKQSNVNAKLGPYYLKVIDALGISEKQARELREIVSKYKNQRVEFQSQGQWAGKANTKTRKNWIAQKEKETINLLGQELYTQLQKVK